MTPRLCWLLIALVLFASGTAGWFPGSIIQLAPPIYAQTTVEKVSGYCERGGQKVSTAGQTSTTTVQKSFPSCTVTVYQTGTSTLQTIYSNSALGAKSNPFTADANGYWEFYSSVSQRLDIQLSGGTAPNNIPTPFFWKSDYNLGGSAFTLSNQGTTVTPSRSKIDLPNPFLNFADDAARTATSLSSKRTPTGVYNAVTDLNISADPRLYETTTTIGVGATSVTLTNVTKETRNSIADGSTNSVYPLRYYANSLNTWKVGQGIRIPDGVSAGVDLIATVTAVSGSTITFTPAVTNANSIDFVQHDDTAAVRSFYSTYTSGTLQIPDGWIPVSSFYNYDANIHPYAISIPSSSEALNHQWVIEGSSEYRSAFVMTGPGHLFKLGSTTTNNLTIRNLGIFHANRYQIQTLDNDTAGAGLYLASNQYNSEGVPQSGATAVNIKGVRLIGWKYAIFSDNLQSSKIQDTSWYYCNNGIFLAATSNVRGLGSQTEPNANSIENTFVQYAPVMSSTNGRDITVTTAGAHNTSGVFIHSASNVITVTSGTVSSTDLYRLVHIQGASVNQTEHTAIITKINSSTEFEISQPPWIENTGLTATLLPRSYVAGVYLNNASNTTVTQGTWQGNWATADTGDELYGFYVKDSDQITYSSIWQEGNGGSAGAAVYAKNVRGLTWQNSNVAANGTPSGYTIGARLNNVIGFTMTGGYIGTAGDAAADIYLENGTRGVFIEHSTLTSPQSILYGNTTGTPNFYPPKLGLGMRYLEGTNSGPVYDAGDLYSTIYGRNILLNGHFGQGLTSWTTTAPAALTAVNTGTARGLRYIQVAPTTGGANQYSEQMAQTVNIPDSIPANQTITLGFDFYIESRGADGIASPPTYNELRVKLIVTGGTTGQFGYNPSASQGRVAQRWERGSITTRIGSGTGRTAKVQIECGQGANAAVFRLSNFRLLYGTKATFDEDEAITELRGGTVQAGAVLKYIDGAGGGTRTICVDNNGVQTYGCVSGGAGTVTSVGLAAGTTGTDVNITGSPITGSGTITLNIPDASATARGVVNTGSQTIAGAKTLTGTLSTVNIVPSTDNTVALGTSIARYTAAHLGSGGLNGLQVHGDAIDTNKVSLTYTGTSAAFDATSTTTSFVWRVSTAGLAMDGSGIVTATGSGGINTSALVTGTLGLVRGGTGQNSWSANQLLVGTGSNTGTLTTVPDCDNATTSKLLYDNATQAFTCGTDQTGAGGTGITTLNGLTTDPQTFANDTNVTMVSSGSTHTITWSGTLAVARGGSGAGTLTGILLGNGTSAFTGLTTSAGIFGAISDETGSGALVGGTSPTITGGVITAITNFSLFNSGTGSFSIRLLANETLTANRTLTVQVQDAARRLSLGGDLVTAGALTTAAAFTTTGANSLTLNTTGSTTVTLPLTGTLATLAGSETFTNKILTSPIINFGSDANGDIITRQAGNYARLAIGSAGQCLIVSGGLPAWGTCAAGSAPVATFVSANYTTLASDRLIMMDATAGNRTVTFLAAGSASGTYTTTCKSTADTSANTVTVTASSISYVLTTPGQCISHTSNGTTWYYYVP